MNENFIREIRINWNQIDKNSYLRKITVLKNLERFEFANPVTFFAGENGSGKSTLLEAIAIASGFNPEGGTKNYHFHTYDSHSELYNALSVVRGSRRERWGFFLRAESFYNVSTMEEEYAKDEKGKYIVEPLMLHEMSHGQSFMEIIKRNFTSGLFIIDEPEAALSPAKQLELIVMIHNCVENGSQFIIASHSPILLGYPDAEIISFDGEELSRIRYEDTSSYWITRRFVNNRTKMLNELISAND